MADLSRVVAVSGSQDFLRRRQVQATIDLQRKNGWKVQVADAADPRSLSGAMNQGSGMFADDKPLLVVVHNPDKVDLALLESHKADKTSTVTMLLVYEDDPKLNTKFGKFMQALGPKAHKNIPLPEKKWEIPKEAVQFCLAESKLLNKPMEERLAEAVVKRCGTDYGFLAFEIQKFAFLAESRGLDKIRAEEIRDVMSSIGEPSFDSIKEALSIRSRVRLATALDRVGKNTKDPIMGLCGFLDYLTLGKKNDKGGDKAAVGWLHLTTLVAQGLSADTIAGQLGVHPWHCQKNLLPEVKAWTPQDVLRLIQATAVSRRAVLSGHIDPWTGLQARLLNVCR